MAKAIFCTDLGLEIGIELERLGLGRKRRSAAGPGQGFDLGANTTSKSVGP